MRNIPQQHPLSHAQTAIFARNVMYVHNDIIHSTDIYMMAAKTTQYRTVRIEYPSVQVHVSGLTKLEIDLRHVSNNNLAGIVHNVPATIEESDDDGVHVHFSLELRLRVAGEGITRTKTKLETYKEGNTCSL